MKQPSTDWHEKIDDDEGERFARQAEQLAAVHAAKSARHGKGRLLHRKALLSARGTFTVLDDLPEPARHGVFAAPGRHEALVRLSNGGMDLQANTKPDIRGFAIKVLGVSGPSSLGATTDHQDFLFINHESFASRGSDEFVGMVCALARGQGALLLHAFRAHGIGGAISRLKTISAVVGKPFTGFAAEPFNTCVPVAVGPYAARVRLRPREPSPSAHRDPAEDMRARLSEGPVSYDVGLQFFVDEAITPIEDPTVVWPEHESPFVTVARLDVTAVEDDLEGQRFDAWGGLEAHRPLGEIMRARKGAYYASQKGRGLA